MRFLLPERSLYMNITPKQMLLYAVSDRSWSNSDEEFLSQAKQAIKSGITIFQLREKHTEYEHFREIALKLKPICKQYNVPLIINDNVKLAKEIDADGVHLGQDDLDIKAAREYLGADKIIGVSAHNVKEALEAENGGADYLGSGAVFYHYGTRFNNEDYYISVCVKTDDKKSADIIKKSDFDIDNEHILLYNVSDN